MNPETTPLNPTSSESQTRCENHTTEPGTTDNPVTTPCTENTQYGQPAHLPDGSEDRQATGQLSEPQEQPPATAPAKRETSEKKKAANRLNSQQSTGPKTARGKANSRRNALKHCLLAEKALFDSKGMPQDEGYHALYLQLLEEYSGNDLITQLRRESLLAAYWRNVQSLRYERDLMERCGARFFESVLMPNLHRYSVANQKALTDRLQELEETPSALLRSEVEPSAEDGDEVIDQSADAATPMERHDNQYSSTDVTSGSTNPAPVDSGLGCSTGTDRPLPSFAGKGVALAAARENESLDQSAKPGPAQNGDAAMPAAWQISGEAESENDSDTAQPPVVQ